MIDPERVPDGQLGRVFFGHVAWTARVEPDLSDALDAKLKRDGFGSRTNLIRHLLAAYLWDPKP